jgi:hypothetical protein
VFAKPAGTVGAYSLSGALVCVVPIEKSRLRRVQAEGGRPSWTRFLQVATPPAPPAGAGDVFSLGGIVLWASDEEARRLRK